VNIWLVIWSILDFAAINHEPPNPEVAPIVCEYFADDCVDALGIAWCESLHNPRAYNGADHGLFQINKYFWYEVFEDSGLTGLMLSSPLGLPSILWSIQN
jgi:hypothetical protein